MIHLGITARRAAGILDMPVSTLYYKSDKAEHDMALASMIREIAFKYTFYGYRRIHVAVNKAGKPVNHKKVYRIYRSLNLQRLKPRKKQEAGGSRAIATDGAIVLQPRLGRGFPL